MSTDPLPMNEVLRRIGDAEEIHVIHFTADGVRIGSDWDRAEVLRVIERDGVINSGPNAAQTGHTLVTNNRDKPVYIQASPHVD